MTLDRIAISVWSQLVTSFVILFAMPSVMIASTLLIMDRLVGTHFFNPAEGGDALLWQHFMLASLWPNCTVERNVRAEDLPRVRRDLVILSAVGIALLVLRIFEFAALDISWDRNAYGSLLWLLIGLHTAHLLTDVGDTLVLTALMFTRHAHGRRFCDVEDNALYWYFVVGGWVFLYVLLYWVPRQ